jgi:hypothetical protein
MRQVLLSALLLTACTQEPSESGCPTPLAATAVTLDTPNGVVAADIKLTGTITRPTGVTIYRVFVEGIAATNDDADYSRFSVMIPFATLKDLANGTASAPLKVTVETNCATPTTESAAFTVKVPVASGMVSSVSLAPDLPLPTTVGAARLVTVVADLASAGTTVTLTTTLGTFDGGATTTTRTLLADDPNTSHAYANVIATPKDGPLPAGTGTITVTGLAKPFSRSIIFVGPPRLTPGAAVVPPSSDFSIDLIREPGRTVTCRATPTPGFSFEYDGIEITELDHASSSNSDDVILVDVLSTAAPKSTATLTCRDDLGQTATATITVPE